MARTLYIALLEKWYEFDGEGITEEIKYMVKPIATILICL